MSDKSVLMSCQISSSGWKLVPVEPTEEMWKKMAAYSGEMYSDAFGKDEFLEDYTAMLAAAPDAPSAEPVAWIGYSIRDGRMEFSVAKPSPSVVRDFNMQPLYAIPPDAAAEIARLRDEVDKWKDAATIANDRFNSVEAHLRDAHDTVSNLQGELLAQADMRRVLGEREAEIQ